MVFTSQDYDDWTVQIFQLLYLIFLSPKPFFTFQTWITSLILNLSSLFHHHRFLLSSTRFHIALPTTNWDFKKFLSTTERYACLKFRFLSPTHFYHLYVSSHFKRHLRLSFWTYLLCFIIIGFDHHLQHFTLHYQRQTEFFKKFFSITKSMHVQI